MNKLGFTEDCLSWVVENACRRAAPESGSLTTVVLSDKSSSVEVWDAESG